MLYIIDSSIFKAQINFFPSATSVDDMGYTFLLIKKKWKKTYSCVLFDKLFV